MAGARRQFVFVTAVFLATLLVFGVLFGIAIGATVAQIAFAIAVVAVMVRAPD